MSAANTTGQSAEPEPATQMLSATQIARALEAPAPTAEQIAVIEAPVESMLIVAGAGSGKTETMASRVLWLVANGHVQPHEVLGLTFTRKASIELATRLAEKMRALQAHGLLPEADVTEGTRTEPPAPLPASSPTVSTYHAYAGRMVAEHGLRVGVEPHARVLSEAACWQLAHETVYSYSGSMEGMDFAEDTVIRAVLDLSAECSEHLVEPEEVRQWLLAQAQRLQRLPPGKGGRATSATKLRRALTQQALMVPLVDAYRQAKRDKSAVDFGDQVAIAARLARDVPAVAASEQGRYRAVLLDEFQDTSEAQMVLLSSLFAGAVPVVAVGDPHQSIYGWRGASATTLNRFPLRFGPAPGVSTPVLSLSTSWRNAHAVLAVANVVAQPLRSSNPVPVAALAAAPHAPTGAVHLQRASTQLEEADAVASWVHERWFDPAGEWTGRSAAVLCRNRAQFSTVAAALRAKGLPVQVVGMGGLLNAPELLDLVALLTVVQEPSRGDAAIRLLVGPVCRLGAADVSALWAWARWLVADYPDEDASLGEAIDHLPAPRWTSSAGVALSDTARRRLVGLSEAISRLRASVGLPLPDLLIEAERSIGLDIEVAADPDVTPGWSRAHLDALIEVAATFAGSADRPTLGGFLSWLDAARAHERALDDVDVPQMAQVSVHTGQVQVMTVHAAKGLEWDVVAVPGLADGTFPVLPGRGVASAGRPPGEASVGAQHSDPQWTYRPFEINGWLTGIGSLPYPLRGDSGGLPRLDLAAVPDGQALTAALADFAAAGVEHREAEERRLAYVALTRARSDMLLSAPVWSTATRPRVTSRFVREVIAVHEESAVTGVEVGRWAAMPVDDTLQNPCAADIERVPWPAPPGGRRAAMTDLVETVLSAAETDPGSGTPVPRDDGGATARDLVRSELIQMLLAERSQRRRPTGQPEPAALPQRMSTSALLEIAADRDLYAQRLRRPMPSPPSPHADLGTRFHAWVEQYFAAPVLLDWAPVDEADEVRGMPHEDAAQLAALQANFRASEWADRAPVDVELAVTTTLAGHSVAGRIDAVFRRFDGGYTVVDWKTGRPASEVEQRRRNLQLAVYRVAYARLVNVDIDRVDGAFFYASTGETMRPELASEATLETLLSDGGVPGIAGGDSAPTLSSQADDER